MGQYAYADCADLPSTCLIFELTCFLDFNRGNAMDETLLTSHDAKRIIVITTLIFWSTCLIILRVERTGSGYYLFLLWNLFLAGIPLVASTCLRLARRCQWPLIIQAG